MSVTSSNSSDGSVFIDNTPVKKSLPIPVVPPKLVIKHFYRAPIVSSSNVSRRPQSATIDSSECTVGGFVVVPIPPEEGSRVAASVSEILMPRYDSSRLTPHHRPSTSSCSPGRMSSTSESPLAFDRALKIEEETAPLIDQSVLKKATAGVWQEVEGYETLPRSEEIKNSIRSLDNHPLPVTKHNIKNSIRSLDNHPLPVTTDNIKRVVAGFTIRIQQINIRVSTLHNEAIQEILDLDQVKRQLDLLLNRLTRFDQEIARVDAEFESIIFNEAGLISREKAEQIDDCRIDILQPIKTFIKAVREKCAVVSAVLPLEYR